METIFVTKAGPKSVFDTSHAFAVRLMQHLVVPTFVLDADRKVLIWNHACERLTGVPAAEIIGTRDHWRAFYDEPRLCLADVLALGKADELDALYAAHTEPSESGLGWRAENWCTMPCVGSRHYLAIDAGPIFDDQGQLVAVVETLRDITEQKEAQMMLQTLVSCDGLTGIANRRAFDERLEFDLRRARRDGASISLLLADVDFFKRYNDNYGHLQGDHCLKQVATALAGAVFRPGDLAARYGGEEFVVIMPNTDVDGALLVAERVRDSLQAEAIPHAYSEVADRVTLSAGVVSLVPDDTTTTQQLIQQADQALYQAKHGGRNQVAVFALAAESSQTASGLALAP